MTSTNKCFTFNRYVWALRLKHILFAILLYLACCYLLSKSDLTGNFSTLLRINFTHSNYAGFLVAHTTFYLLFEELAFRAVLNKSKIELTISVILLLILSIQQFTSGAFSFYVFAFYGLFLLAQLNKSSPLDRAIFIDKFLCLCALSCFHLLKFELSNLEMFDLLLNYILPIVILGMILMYLRHHYSIVESLLCYLFLHLLIDLWLN